MTYTRSDLLELTPDALIAMANAGFVKKALKELESGTAPHIEEDADGAIHAHYQDGTRTTLPPGRTLREADCTCAASGMCRHRVMLVLAYQVVAGNAASSQTDETGMPDADTDATPWSPANFDDHLLETVFSASALSQAARLAAEHPAATVLPWQPERTTPSVRLPMSTVRFFSRSSPIHARCDCKEGSGCAHVVLAVWAFRQAHQQDQAEAVVEILPPETITGDKNRHPSTSNGLMQSEAACKAVNAIENVLNLLWSDGAAQPLLALEARVTDARNQCASLGWRWVEEAVDELWHLIKAQHARSSRFEPRLLLDACANTWARLQAAAHTEQTPGAPLPVRQILGIGEKGEVALDHLRLTSLGLDLWADDEAEGADIIFADQDTQTLMLLERSWPRTAQANQSAPRTDVLNRRAAGQPLRKLGAGQVVTKAATRRANGILDIAANTRQTNLFPLSPRSWNELTAPIRHTTVRDLISHMRQALPDFVRPVQALKHFHVVALQQIEVSAWGWDAAQQTVRACLCSGADQDDAPLHLVLPYSTATPHAVDAAAQVLSGEWGALTAVSGMAWLEYGEAHLRPLAFMTENRAIVLQAEDAPPQSLDQHRMNREDSAARKTVDAVLELLVHWLRRGLRHLGRNAATQALEQAQELENQGLKLCAGQVRTIAGQLQAAQAHPPGRELAKLALLLKSISQGIKISPLPEGEG